MAAGGLGNDTITGSGTDDIIDGNADNDTLSGGGGSDLIGGDAGTDIVNGDGGDDFVFGFLALTKQNFEQDFLHAGTSLVGFGTFYFDDIPGIDSAPNTLAGETAMISWSAPTATTR